MKFFPLRTASRNSYIPFGITVFIGSVYTVSLCDTLAGLGRRLAAAEFFELFSTDEGHEFFVTRGIPCVNIHTWLMSLKKAELRVQRVAYYITPKYYHFLVVD